MRQTIGTWKASKTMENIAARLENSLYWEDIYEKARQLSEIEHNETPQFVSQTGNEQDTILGRIIHKRTHRPNRTWDQRGTDALEEANQHKAEEAKRQQDLGKMWKSKDQELENIFDRLSDI